MLLRNTNFLPLKHFNCFYAAASHYINIQPHIQVQTTPSVYGMWFACKNVGEENNCENFGFGFGWKPFRPQVMNSPFFLKIREWNVGVWKIEESWENRRVRISHSGSMAYKVYFRIIGIIFKQNEEKLKNKLSIVYCMFKIKFKKVTNFW